MKLQKKKTKTKTKKQKQHNNDLPQFLKVVLPLPFPRKKRGVEWGGGGGVGGGVSLIISQGQVNSIKVIASKSCVLLRYMKFRHQLIFITGVRLGSFLTINLLRMSKRIKGPINNLYVKQVALCY